MQLGVFHTQEDSSPHQKCISRMLLGLVALPALLRNTEWNGHGDGSEQLFEEKISKSFCFG